MSQNPELLLDFDAQLLWNVGLSQAIGFEQKIPAMQTTAGSDAQSESACGPLVWR